MALVGTAIVEGLAKLLMHSQSNLHLAQTGMEDVDIIKVATLPYQPVPTACANFAEEFTIISFQVPCALLLPQMGLSMFDRIS